MIAPEINLSLLLISGFGFRHRTANAIAKPLFTKFHWLEQMTTLPGLRILLLPASFCDAKAANLVLQGRTFQSEPFGGSSPARNSPRRSS